MSLSFQLLTPFNIFFIVISSLAAFIGIIFTASAQHPEMNCITDSELKRSFKRAVEEALYFSGESTLNVHSISRLRPLIFLAQQLQREQIVTGNETMEAPLEAASDGDHLPSLIQPEAVTADDDIRIEIADFSEEGDDEEQPLISENAAREAPLTSLYSAQRSPTLFQAAIDSVKICLNYWLTTTEEEDLAETYFHRV